MERLWVFGFIILILNCSILRVDGWWSSRRRSCTKVNCRLTSWSSWSACSKTCGLFATQKRRRTVLTSATCGGSCGKLVDFQECKYVCCPVNCVYSWSAWSSCKGCGLNGEQTSLRIISQNEWCSGTCNAKPSRKRTCDTRK